MLVGEGLDVLKLLYGVLGAGDDGDVALDGKLAGGDLVAERINRVRRRPNEL